MDAEAVVQYDEVVYDRQRNGWVARVYRGRQPGGLWEGWFVFFPLSGGRALSTDRETTQSSPRQIEYWAGGITYAYLEGALARAIRNTPESKLDRRRQFLEREEAVAVAEAALYERAAARALSQAADTARRRREHPAPSRRPRDADARYEEEAAEARKLAAEAEGRRAELEEDLRS